MPLQPGHGLRRRSLLIVLAMATLSATALVSAAGAENALTKESGNPIDDQGSSYHYRTYITSITPKVPGLSVEVLEFADRLLLRNGHRQDGDGVRVLRRALRPRAPRRCRSAEPSLAGGVPEHELLCRCDVPSFASRRRRRSGKRSIARASSNGTTTASTG